MLIYTKYFGNTRSNFLTCAIFKGNINIFIRPENINFLSQIFKIKFMTEKNVKVDFCFQKLFFY